MEAEIFDALQVSRTPWIHKRWRLGGLWINLPRVLSFKFGLGFVMLAFLGDVAAEVGRPFNSRGLACALLGVDYFFIVGWGFSGGNPGL